MAVTLADEINSRFDSISSVVQYLAMLSSASETSSSRSAPFVAAEKPSRIAGGLKEQFECSYTISGAANLNFFNVKNAPESMFRVKADTPPPEDCLVHKKEAGQAIVSPAAKHSVSCVLLQDDSIVLRTPDEAVMVHSATGAGQHQVGLNMLCSFPSQAAADACMAELQQSRLPSGLRPGSAATLCT